MSAQNVDKIVQLYKTLARIPALLDAKLCLNNTQIQSIWSQRNLERGKSTRFLRNINISSDLQKISEAIPIDTSNELLSSTSPSGKYRAVLRDLNEKQYLEVWQQVNLIRSVDLNALDIHGDVYTDGEFATFKWSPDETKLLYLAEFKVPKSEPFYKRAGKPESGDNEKEKPSKGDEYLFRQDWGEQLVGKRRSVIAQYNVDGDSVEILQGIPEDVTPAKVSYSSDGSYLIGLVYNTEPRKLGLIFCANRLSTLFSLDFAGNYVTLNLENKSVKAPIITPDGKNVIWLQRNAGGVHASTMQLVKTSLPFTKESSYEVIVDIVNKEIDIENGRKFTGLYNQSFVRRCFASNNRLLLSTQQKNTIDSYIVDLDSGAITELEYADGSQIVLDVVDDVVLVNRRNCFRQDVLAVCKLPSKTSKVPLNWIELTGNSTVEGLENMTYKYFELAQPNQDSVNYFTAIYYGPKCAQPHSVPLIIYPHGGPHSAFANYLALEFAFLLSAGYAILLINYRGSLGYGEDSVTFLPSRIGRSDVDDCILATDRALETYDFLDANKLILCGGSHGGFLVAHLSGQYPDKYKVVLSRNPVIDVASMSVLSDIPDWCYVEGGKEYTQKGAVDDQLLLTMRKVSPIEYAHRIKAPTFLSLGSKDLRVPQHQGLELYTRLKANGVPVRLNMYDDNHSIMSVANEMDKLINSVLWIEKHLD